MSESEPGSAIASPILEVICLPEGRAESVKALFTVPQPRIIKSDVVEAIDEIRAALDEALAESAQIMAHAHAQADEVREAARAEGQQAGHAEVLTELCKARAEYRGLQDQAEQDMVEMAFRIAERLIGHAITADPTIVKGIVVKSLEHVRGKRQVVILVHPDDLPVITAARDEVAAEVEGTKVYFEASEHVERGGCVLETESGRIDARLTTQMNVLRDALIQRNS